MDIVDALLTAAIGVVASAATAYITVRINAKRERKIFEREIASKMAEFRDPPDDRTRIMAVQFAESFLVIDRGLEVDREKVFLPSGCRITLGRNVNNHIVVDSDFVSGTHMAFKASNSKVWLEPLAPTIPVLINGNRISESTQLESGDKISIDGITDISITFKHLA